MKEGLLNQMRLLKARSSDKSDTRLDRAMGLLSTGGTPEIVKQALGLMQEVNWSVNKLDPQLQERLLKGKIDPRTGLRYHVELPVGDFPQSPAPNSQPIAAPVPPIDLVKKRRNAIYDKYRALPSTPENKRALEDEIYQFGIHNPVPK
jgi:hypothetical protein